MEIDTSTKSNVDGSIIPTNPFQIVEMIRKVKAVKEGSENDTGY